MFLCVFMYSHFPLQFSVSLLFSPVIGCSSSFFFCLGTFPYSGLTDLHVDIVDFRTIH